MAQDICTIVPIDILRHKLQQRFGVRGQRNCFLLQGTVGPFFAKLQKALKETGYNPVKINFNGGDWMFARGGDTVNYRGKLSDWSEWFADILQLAQPEFIILIGDERPLHAAAIKIARAMAVPVWVLEEGYVRPNFITCELYGVNANSPLANAPLDLRERFAGLPLHQDLGKSSFIYIATYATLYYFGLKLGSPFFPRYEHHRNRRLIGEFVMWTRNAWRKKINANINKRLIANLAANHNKKYFVVALQVSDDLQLVAHGRGWTVERLITACIRSFSRCAPAEAVLVFKGHPMDRGHFPHGKTIRAIARLSGCEDKIFFIDDGSIGTMIRRAKGLVTINSTSGVSALHHGTPVICLGDAFYSNSNLVLHGKSLDALDAFWHNPQAPDAAVSKAFLAKIFRECLVNGDFYDRTKYEVTISNLIAHIQAKMTKAGRGGSEQPEILHKNSRKTSM